MDYIMSIMNITLSLSGNDLEATAVKTFAVFRDNVRPALETRRPELE